MNDRIKQKIEDILKEKIIHSLPVSGGSIAQNFLLNSEKRHTYFLKTGCSTPRMFPCEANGLNEIAQTQTFRTPQVIFVCEELLLMEAISPQKPSGDFFFKELGQKLADMHRVYSSQFGFFEDNFIGSTPQINKATKANSNNWALFYFENRLLFQYRIAEHKGYISPRLRQGVSYLENHLEELLKGSEEKPCLLHGDLWSGNYLCNENQFPVLIDPAVYYGHRETDLAMTLLFGGFPPSFYQSYQEAYPLSVGWETRMNIYKLYHILNHLNMFGTGYLREAENLAICYM